MEYEFLKSLELILIASAAVVLLLYGLKMPPLVGFIIAGIIIGKENLSEVFYIWECFVTLLFLIQQSNFQVDILLFD